MKRNIFFRIGVCIFASVLTLSCSISEPQSDPSVEPSVEPYIPPVTDVSPTNTPLPPSPDFPDDILFFGYGGGGGFGNCADFSSFPAVVGQINYPTDFVDFQSYSGVGPNFDYPRRADLCLGGVPKDQRIEIKLISPSQNTILNTAIQIQDSKQISGDLVLYWLEYPFAWTDVFHRSSIFINSNAGLEWDDNQNPVGPILASLNFWWPGDLESGIWKVEVSWPGQTVYGDFMAETRRLPEVSLGEPAGNSRIVPIVNSDYPYACRPAMHEQPYFAVVEGFVANHPVYVLVYQATQYGWDYQMTLVYKAAVNTNEQGMGRVDLPFAFQRGAQYFLFATADPAVKLTVDTKMRSGVFNFTAIANAMDCFIVPNQTILSCPGAPPQRMTVNQRGYACTRSDPVRVRVSPARSANTLVQVEPGTQFTVIGGPFCSDDWSWWNVRLDEGTTGWLAEGGDEIDPYFICPLP
jgi:hypothetical protein